MGEFEPDWTGSSLQPLQEELESREGPEANQRGTQCLPFVCKWLLTGRTG